jgi:hypothetical protein
MSNINFVDHIGFLDLVIRIMLINITLSFAGGREAYDPKTEIPKLQAPEIDYEGY